MCLKYVNATVGLYSKVDLDQNGNAVAFSGAFDHLIARKEPSGDLAADNFEVVIHFNLLGTDTQAHKPNCLVEQRKGVLEVCVKLSRVSKDPEQQVAMILDEFPLDLEQLDNQHYFQHACFSYLNYCRVIHTGHLVFMPGPGNYVIKVEARWKRDDGQENPFAVQALYPLHVIEPSEG